MYIIVTFWIEVSIIQNRNSFHVLILPIFQYIFFVSKYISSGGNFYLHVIDF